MDITLDKITQEQLSTFRTGHIVNQSFKWLPLISAMFAETGDDKKEEVLHRLKLLGLSELFVVAILELCSRMLPRERPDPTMAHDSFPSGHTAQAFLGAEILRQRIQHRAPVLALTGYGMAVTMGLFRLTSKKHWLSDVVAGAALGILAAKLAGAIIKKDPLFTRFRQLIRDVKTIRKGRAMNTTLPYFE